MSRTTKVPRPENYTINTEVRNDEDDWPWTEETQPNVREVTVDDLMKSHVIHHLKRIGTVTGLRIMLEPTDASAFCVARCH